MKENNKKIICIGGANIDYKFNLMNELMPNTSNPITTKSSFGGVARNVAENLGRLELDVSLLTLVGEDSAGEELINYSSEYFNTSLIEKINSYKTGSYYAVMDKSGEMQIAYADMSICEKMDSLWLNNYLEILKDYAYIIADLNLKKSTLEKLISWSINNQKILTIIGVSGPKMHNLPQNIKDVDLIICNQDESESYFSKSADLKELCRLWLEKEVKKSVITSGSKKIIFGDNINNIDAIPILKIAEEKIVDVTGAGDAFSAGLIFGLINDLKFKDAIRLGMINAGKTILSEDSVRKDLNKNKLFEEAKINGNNQ